MMSIRDPKLRLMYREARFASLLPFFVRAESDWPVMVLLLLETLSP